MPKISIILTSFNHEKYIGEAIDSVLAQTFTDYELIIWDDASTDDSWKIVNSYSDSRIKVVLNDATRGPVFGVNKAISEMVSGEYIAIHHSDDIWEQDKLTKQVAFLELHPEVGAVFTNAQAIGEDGQPFNDPEHFYSDIFNQPNRTRHEWLNHFFYQGNVLCHPSVLIRKKCYEDCGHYRKGLAQLPDFDMWIRLCLRYEIHVLPEKLVKFRVRDNEANTSGNRPETRIRGSVEFYQVLRNFLAVPSVGELFAIFPQAKKYVADGSAEGNPNFILAMLLLEGGSPPYSKLLAFDILFQLLNNKRSAKQLKFAHGFDELDLIRLTGEVNLFLNENIELPSLAVAERDKQIASLNQMVAERDKRITDIRRSTSWRITMPLRFVATTTRKMRRLASSLPHILHKGGGFWPTVFKTVHILRNEGVHGVRLRTRGFFANKAFNASVGEVSESKYFIVPYYIDPRVDSTVPVPDLEGSVAVHLHLYYTEMLGEFAAYLNNIPVNYDLYVSVLQAADVNAIQNELKSLLRHAVNIVVESVPNQGRDIAPMIIQFGKRLAKYGIIAHIHATQNSHDNVLEGWSQDILKALFGVPKTSGGRIAHIIGMLETTAKIIFPEGHTEFIKDRSGWAANYDLAKQLLDKYTQLSIKDFPGFAFPKGSMFWARTECLKDLLGLPLSYSDFPSESIADDGTLAHVLERLILVFASQYEGQPVRIHEMDSINDYRQYEEQQDYSARFIHSDVKVLSYYLPQFHPIPENDLWHGKGFTEWTKVRAANPLFEGHYQQHIPHSDIGYYLLDSPEVLRRQADQMRQSGVYGQVFYHYWFTGKLILEEPAQQLLSTPDIQMPFCFCWANENWTRRWDGNENEILLGQNYSEKDARDFIHYLIPFFKDHRYIKVEDRPVLFVYRPSSIPNSQEYLDIWEGECTKAGIKRPYVVAVLTRGAINPMDFGMDAGVERVLHDWTNGAVPEIKNSLRQYREINGSVLSYNEVANFYMGQKETKDFAYFRSTVPIWDNTARYGTHAYLLHGSTPQRFQEWMERSIAYTKSTLPEDRRFLLVNAWNEWAEGAHLEPDSRYGYSYLNSVGRALSDIPYSGELNPSNAIASGTTLHLFFSRLIMDQIQSDHVLRERFIHCLAESSILNICTVSTNVPDLVKNASISILQSDPDAADFILEFRRVAYFDSSVIERMLQTGCATGAAVIANTYGDDGPLFEVAANGSVDAFYAHSAPMLLVSKTAKVLGYKNCRVRTDAHCFVAHPSVNGNANRPTVTTIIRFHRSADLNELRNALYCLYAMRDCLVIPLIAAQDLNEEQMMALLRLVGEFAWPKGQEPQIYAYQSEGGIGDLRSKMLNESLKKVGTRFAAFLDFDDLLMPHAYRWLIDRLERTGKAVSFGRVYATSYDSSRQLILERKCAYEYGYTYGDFVKHNHAPLHSFMLDMERLDLSHVVYFEDQRYMEDYLLTLQIFTKDNCDWDSLSENLYLGDYIHSTDRGHTLALSDVQQRQDLLSNPEYILCDQRIREFRIKAQVGP